MEPNLTGEKAAALDGLMKIAARLDVPHLRMLTEYAEFLFARQQSPARHQGRH